MEWVSLVTLIASVLSSIAATLAAYGAITGAKAWKASVRYERRCDAVTAWVGGAATFRGRLKFIYGGNLTWPEDKDEIEYLSAHFWAWVALWPSVNASLTGEAKVHAQRLWTAVFDEYREVMSGTALDRLEAAVEAVYNSELLHDLYKNPH
ncbi:hypothetical protein [Xanthomonas pisi]|uniref:Uncharacterized protein n=1 Tax=Xanthomonas pisi TaxID=56457 RepID=A0A2S7CY38_9XANT|nr:hypothetical protein [Xanthomonas pisi]KLD71236.1 hypothetical protein Y887_07445 [Xanthomonas pisi DSM 18956]PPU66460.1 hypothetical protein XpiCFBP4643_19050 [Xanthomonas pisi]